MGTPSLNRRALPAAPKLPSLLLLVLLVAAAGVLLPSPSSAVPGKKAYVHPRPDAPHTPRAFGPLKLDAFDDGNCTLNASLVLPPLAQCNYYADYQRTANECYESCFSDFSCYYYTFISTPGWEQPTCYYFSEDSFLGYCNASDLVPPSPEWGETVSGAWFGGNCTDDVTAPLTTPFPFGQGYFNGECFTDPPVVLTPGSPCQLQAYSYRTEEKCQSGCYHDEYCFFYTFYSNSPKGTPNCYFFASSFYGGDNACNEKSLAPPDPEWGTMVYAWYSSQLCPDLTYIYGDPHFVGARGTQFDFNGELGKTYCLVTDKKFHINALLAGYKAHSVVGASVSASGKGVRSWMRELGIIWSDTNGLEHTLQLVARVGQSNRRDEGFLAAAELDGKPLALHNSVGPVVDSELLQFTFLGTKASKAAEKDVFRVLIPSMVDMTLELQPPSLPYQLPNEAFVHFNIMLNKLEMSSAIHGVLGQTYRKSSAQLLKAVKFSLLSKMLGEPIKADGASGYGFLDGSTGDYVASGVLKPDCAHTAFAK